MSSWKNGHNIGAKVARSKHSRDKAEAKDALYQALRIGNAAVTYAARPITLAKVAWLDRCVEFDRAYEAKYGNLQRGSDRKGAKRAA